VGVLGVLGVCENITDPPSRMSGIKRVTTLTILGVTVTNKLSFSEHVRTVVNSCAQIMHVIRILRSRGMDDAIKLQLLPCNARRKTYLASIAPDGASPLHRTGNALKVFCVAAVDKICTHLTSPSTTQLAEADENLFRNIRYNLSHLLHHILPR